MKHQIFGAKIIPRTSCLQLLNLEGASVCWPFPVGELSLPPAGQQRLLLTYEIQVIICKFRPDPVP